jgi:hypothetical protein
MNYEAGPYITHLTYLEFKRGLGDQTTVKLDFFGASLYIQNENKFGGVLVGISSIHSPELCKYLEDLHPRALKSNMLLLSALEVESVISFVEIIKGVKLTSSP